MLDWHSCQICYPLKIKLLLLLLLKKHRPSNTRSIKNICFKNVACTWRSPFTFRDHRAGDPEG